MFLEPCDLIFCESQTPLGRLIRFFSRGWGQPKAKAQHVLGVTVGQVIWWAIVIEALSTVVCRTLSDGYGDGKTLLTIYRPLNLTPEEKEAIAHKAESYLGRPYGYLKILAHFGDYFLGGRYFFRRLCRLDNYPICSWVWAEAYAAAGKTFGLPPGEAQPDDMQDFCDANPDKFALIYGPAPLPPEDITDGQ
jgi:hypothetical protein